MFLFNRQKKNGPCEASPPRDQKKLGAEGEKAAARFLKKAGYRILARNYTCPLGEIDIIAHGDGAIVFVEVKTRADDAAANPEANITPAKQRQVSRVARFWLRAHGEPDCPWRFDALSVILPPGGKPVVRQIVSAFAPAF